MKIGRLWNGKSQKEGKTRQCTKVFVSKRVIFVTLLLFCLHAQLYNSIIKISKNNKSRKGSKVKAKSLHRSGIFVVPFFLRQDAALIEGKIPLIFSSQRGWIFFFGVKIRDLRLLRLFGVDSKRWIPWFLFGECHVGSV